MKTLSIVVSSSLIATIVSGAINWICSAFLQRREREIAFLRDQLQQLYGPLHYFVSQNSGLLDFLRDMDKAYEEEFSAKYPAEENASKKTIEVMNDYASLVRQNNAPIMQILRENWSLIDPEDVETFSHFQVTVMRQETEYSPERVLRLPGGMADRLGGGIPYLDPGFKQQVENKFHAKRRRLEQLLKRKRVAGVG